ncbi:hypothetical protein [Paracidovorax cattleyae]|uniref:Uncharacterized protein n=1 Tax=Paracidovorax cattleyae TaxID=80868 RepID=A0A1H0WUL8_9BURK|nr:hypothetical protein [Paracidovorax cattleyae]SDP94155.1 hypothetical protein SAMN04489708_1594 [Paracidovorax cattleyae]
MQRVIGYFDELHFAESNLGTPIFEVGSMKIPVTGLLTLRGHPLNDGTFRPLTGKLVFIGVTKSVRKLTEYIGDPKQPQGFKDERIVADLDVQAQPEGKRFLLEGILQEPVAWVDWEVVAAGFEFHAD